MGMAVKQVCGFTPRAEDKCSVCDSGKVLDTRCPICNKPLCGECGIKFAPVRFRGWHIHYGGKACKDCVHDVYLKADEDKQDILDSELVRYWANGFKGVSKAPVLNKFLLTEYCSSRERAIASLKVLAVKEGAFFMTDVRSDVDVKSGCNLWYATGVI